MRKLIGAVAIFLSVLAWHTEAQAACVTNTIMGPGGSVTFCTTCCYSGGSCTTTCI